MPLRWFSQPAASEEPQIVLAAPGSVAPGSQRRWLLQALAAGSVALVAFRPLPRAAATAFNVINLNGDGPGSLRAAIESANANPGFDTVTFNPGLTGTIPITTQLTITDSIQIIGPGPGALAVSGSNQTRVFYLYSSAFFTSTISGLTVRDGFTSDSYGGAGILDAGEPLVLDNVRLVSNTASATGGGGGVNILPVSPYRGALTVSNSVITGNHGSNGGGISAYYSSHAILIQNTQIVSNTADYRGGGVALYVPAGTVTIQSSTIISNSAGASGGGVALYAPLGAVTIQTSSILSNSAGSAGGGVDVYKPVGDVLIEDSTLAANSSDYGGGVEFAKTYGGGLTVRRTTITGNNAVAGGGLDLYLVSDLALVENSTISGNYATESGGGVYAYNNEAAAIRSSTIVSNTAVQRGGGVAIRVGSLPITNTIVAGNGAPLDADLSVLTGTFQLKYDLVQVTGTATISNAGGNLFGLDPLLGPLANNGGPTQTHLPLPGSPAIDAGDPAFAPPPSTDQRGDPRVSGGRVDIGALETAAALMPGAVQFSTSAFQAAESGLVATITVTRTGGNDGAIAVDYATGGGTATAGSDYQATSGTLHWANGDALPKSFTVALANDGIVESSETVGLTLSNAQGGAVLGAPITATLTILDSGARVFLPLVER